MNYKRRWDAVEWMKGKSLNKVIDCRKKKEKCKNGIFLRSYTKGLNGGLRFLK